MDLGEEQFKVVNSLINYIMLYMKLCSINKYSNYIQLCTELSFQSGLLSYVALHCVEAASLLGMLIAELNPASNAFKRG